MADSYFPASNRTIMVVDDELEMVKVVRGMLKEKGFNVTCAYDGTQVFDVLKQQKPDLILLDIMMPQMNGLEVLTRLKGNPATGVSIPLLDYFRIEKGSILKKDIGESPFVLVLVL